MANSIKALLRRLRRRRRSKRPGFEDRMVSLKTDQPARGAVLIGYIVEAYLTKDEARLHSHTHFLETVAMAEAFLGLGYDVDVIDYRNGGFTPTRDYRFFVSARTEFERVATRLNDDCAKIAHMDTSHYLFNNAAAFGRSLALTRRRGAVVHSIRVIETNFAAEAADYLSVLGNGFTMGTYAYAGKPMFEIPVPSSVDFASPADKDFSSARNRFIWLGSSGLVHKGLDVALEAFAEMPECHLSVCGPLDAASERRFVDLYRSELYELPNVSAVGWVNVREPAFQALVAGSVGLIYPSCAEGQSGAVVTCLRAGLIPIVSHESGVDVGDFGFELRDCSVEEIKRRVTAVSQLPEDALSGMSMRAWEHGNRVHGKAHYVETFGQMIRQIEAERGAPARQR